MIESQKDVETILSALGDQLESLLDKPVELLVCGGSALNVLGLVRRATKDVDILAYIERNEKGETFLIKADSLSPELVTAAKKVAHDFNLPDDWLNTGPASAVDLGLPNGIMDRVTTRVFGNKLAVHFLGHYDQIHFKLYAAVDQGAGKHLDDLLALKPTSEEIESAARWSMTHDVSDGYKQNLKNLLKYMGFEDVAERL
jgi:hypothetical protein